MNGLRHPVGIDQTGFKRSLASAGRCAVYVLREGFLIFFSYIAVSVTHGSLFETYPFLANVDMSVTGSVS
jgi:hypothetical protein